MGKVKIGLFFYLIYFDRSFMDMLFEKPSTLHMNMVQTTEFDLLLWHPIYYICEKKKKNLLLRSRKRDEAETFEKRS